MAKFSKTNHYDYMRFKATFPDGKVLSGNYSRNGHTISLTPYDPELARQIATVFWNVDHTGVDGFNLGRMFEILEPAALKSNTIKQML